MRLIVGLGNPGDDYIDTRHNVGFYMIDMYLESKGLNNYKTKFNGLYIMALFNDEKVIFLKPQSYMNLSGEVVRKFVDYYKIDIEDVMVISDDIDLDLGVYRLRNSGKSAGHNGLKNIELHLQTQNYKRLKVGVSRDKAYETADYVLGKFKSDEVKVREKISINIGNVLDDYFKMEFLELMNKYNRKATG